MIAIINRGPEGEYHRYTVGINERVLFGFHHCRENGLSQCLYLAYRAAQEYEIREAMENQEVYSEEVGSDENST